MRSNIALILMLSLWFACEFSSTIPADPGITVDVSVMGYDSIADTSITGNFKFLATSTINNVVFVSLGDIISTSLIPQYNYNTPEDPRDDIDRRPLFAYRLIGSDGYSAHEAKNADDQPWEHMFKGYLDKSTRDAYFDASLHVTGMYRVKDVAHIEIYRKINIIVPDTGFCVELADIAKTQVSGEPSVKLALILQKVPSPEHYSYSIEAIDGYAKNFSWEQIQTGNLLLISDQLLFDPDLGDVSKIKNVYKIIGTIKK